MVKELAGAFPTLFASAAGQARGKAPSKVRERRVALRAQLWPTVTDNDVWRGDKKRPGYTMIPRTLQLMLTAMDSLSKGKPVSSTYFDLWCRAFDEQFVSLNRSKEMAFFAGFSGERAERTWIDRIRILEQLGFISLKPGPTGAYSYALLYNPYHVLARLHESGKLHGMFWNALLDRMSEIGTADLNVIASVAAPPTKTPPEAKQAAE